MGLHLIAATGYLQWFGNILQVAIGLGMVIFVHELGHFVVAKLCGVKCEKFYLGFDIYGLKLFRFRYGETEYGIGILPLGGYVKMLGQDDNPAKAAEERERSKLANMSGDLPPETAPAHPETLDPRSYMAQSVPERMAIISAGVIMNVIFAVLMAMVAYRMGVSDIACAIGGLLPGQAAWQADLHPGDEVLQIGDEPPRHPLRFRDLQAAVYLSNLEEGVKFKVKRKGIAEPFFVTIKPDTSKDQLAPSIGALSPSTTALLEERPVAKGSPAAKAKKFESNDTIVAVDNRTVAEHADVLAELAQQPDKTLDIGVSRATTEKGDAKVLQQITVPVPANPLKTLGLVMKMGKITAIQKNSPADAAGLEAGDFIIRLDAEPDADADADDEPLTLGDPMTLPDRLRKRANDFVTITFTRKQTTGPEKTLVEKVKLREPMWYESPVSENSPMSAPALGIAYQVLSVIAEAPKPGTPAAKAEVMKGDKPATVSQLVGDDEIVNAKFILPTKLKDAKDDDARPDPRDLKFSDEKANWPLFSTILQELPEGTKVKLTLRDERTVEIEPAASDEFFNPERGFRFSQKKILRKAETWGDAVPMALHETKDALLQVYAFLRKIGTQISPKGLGGPVTIFKAAGAAADEGLPDLLLFLTMLSANLAVINFLPIPLLDGGHMVLLTLEAIFRKPVSERVVGYFQWAGLIFILSLMAFVLSLDLGLLSRFPT